MIRAMSRTERLLAVGVAVAALMWGWPTLGGGYEGPYDEGNTLCGALRAARGEAPYRDFWLLHPPGTTWLLAGAFRAFGATLGVERAAKIAAVALAAVLVFLLARLAARPLAAALAALLFVALPTQTLSLRSRDLGLVFVLAALLAACAPSSRPRRRALVAGFLAGLTAWVKQDFAAAAAVGAGAALALEAGARARLARRTRPGGSPIRPSAGVLVPFALGLCAGVASLAATLAMHGTLGEFFRQAILFPATSFGRFRSLPLSLRFEQLAGALGPGISPEGLRDVAAVPVLFGVALAAAFAAAVPALAEAIRSLRRDADGPEGADEAACSWSVPLASSLACLFLLAAPYQRADLEHLNPALALSLVALAGVTAPRGQDRASGARLAPGISLGLLVFLIALPSGFERARLLKARLLGRPTDGATGLPAAPRWIGLPREVAETARFVAERTRPGERIFVGNARHDALGYGAPLVSFLAGRTGATRYDNLHPGVVTTRAVQEEIVRSLESAHARCAVLWDGPPLGEPNESSASSGVTVLDDWLAANGRDVARFGTFRVRWIGETAAPPPAR